MKMYKFINFPKSIWIDVYNYEKESFLNDIKSIFKWNKFSLYLIWELWLLWVSDLDFLILSDDFAHKDEILDSLVKYKLVDTPLFLKYNDLNKIEYFTHHYNFEYVWWEEIDKKMFWKYNKNLFLIYSWRILFFSWLRNFYIPFYNKEIDIKKVLSWINDLRYPIYYLSKIIKLDDDILKFVNEYEIFRKTWFEHKNKEKLLDFLIKWINISWKLIEVLSKNIILDDKNTLVIYWRFPTVFKNTKNLDFKRETELYFEKISNIDRFLVLPCSMYYKNWNLELIKTLENVLKLNNWFLKFWFDSNLLNIILFFKKIVDFIKISIYKFYEKN